MDASHHASAAGELLVDSVAHRNSTHIATQGDVIIAGGLQVDGQIVSTSPATVSASVTTDAVLCNTLVGPAVNKLHPFWVHGEDNGATLQVMTSSGRASFTVTRATSQTTGYVV